MRYASSSPLDNFNRLVQRGGIPVTNGLLIVNVITFFLTFLGGRFVNEFIESQLAFHSRLFLHAPWTIITYTIISTSPIALLWAGIMLWFTGGSLERAWGSDRYAKLFFSLAAISALCYMLGGFLLKTDVSLEGVYLPLCGVVVAFCALNPEQSFCFWFVTIRAQYLMIITFIIAWYMFGAVLGLFACGGLLAAYLYVRFGRAWARPARFSGPDLRDSKVIHLNTRRPTRNRASYIDGSIQRSPLDFAGRMKDYQEKKKLERLLRNSGIKDPDRDDDNRRIR